MLSIPASTAKVTSTSTWAVSFTQGVGTMTTYVYIPVASDKALNVPLNGLPLGASQSPPVSGVPCKRVKREIASAEEQSAMEPSPPASALLTTFTERTALTDGQGAAPGMV